MKDINNCIHPPPPARSYFSTSVSIIISSLPMTVVEKTETKGKKTPRETTPSDVWTHRTEQPALEMRGQKKMHAHARAQTSIHSYMKEHFLKKSDDTRLPAHAANSSGASKMASFDHFQWKWWQSERAVSIESQCAAVWQTSGPL